MNMKLIRPESLTIYPIDTAAPIDALSRRPREFTHRLTAISLPAQIESLSEKNTPGASVRGLNWFFLVTIKKQDCDRLGYTPKLGDKITSVGFLYRTSRSDTVYVQDVKAFCEGFGFQLAVADKQPTRGV